jgi:hypothetical protein
MTSIWTFIRKPSNQRLLSWLGGGTAVAAAGIWAVVTYVWPAHETPRAECIQDSVKIGGASPARRSAIPSPVVRQRRRHA